MKPDLFDFIEKHNLHDAVREKVRFYDGLAEIINTIHIKLWERCNSAQLESIWSAKFISFSLLFTIF